MSSLSKYIAELEKIEFNSDKDIDRYAKTLKRVSRELHQRIGMDADMLGATLGQYKGRWYEFGLGSKARGRLVAAHLRVSAEAVRACGVGAAKMHGAFRKHFVEPERQARAAQERSRRGRGGGARKFTIDEEK